MVSNGKVENSSSQRHKDVVLFLKEELKRIQENRDVKTYNIEEEYSKTKKNKNIFTWIMLFCCFVVILFSSFLITLSITKKNSEIAVSLNVFDDLNLKSLVNNVQKVQTNYDNALKNKAQIQTLYESSLTQAATKRDNDLFLIKSLNLDDKRDRDNRIKAINSEYKETVAQIEKTYSENIKKADIDIAIYKEQLDEYDSDKIEIAKERERVLDSERQLKELESKLLSEKYERRIYDLENTIKNERSSSKKELVSAITEVSSKYQAEINRLDPRLNDKIATEIITNNLITDAVIFDSPSIINQFELSDDATLTNGFDAFQKRYDDFRYLHATVSSIPQKNSIPSYTATENSLVNKMAQIFAQTSAALHAEKVVLTNKLESLTAKYNSLEGKYSVLEKKYADLESKYAALDQRYKNLDEKNQELSAAYDSAKKIPGLYDVAVDSMLVQRGWHGVVLYTNDEQIKVYVRKDIVEKQMLENSAPAEIVKAGKGVVELCEDGTFIFVPIASDSKNNFNIQAVLPGTQIKVLKK